MSIAIITGCLAIGAVASILGVSTRILRRWDKAGTMKARREAGIKSQHACRHCC